MSDYTPNQADPNVQPQQNSQPVQPPVMPPMNNRPMQQPVMPQMNNQPMQQPMVQQVYSQPPVYGVPQPVGTAQLPGKGMGTASLVLGIIANVLLFAWYIGLPTGIISIILGGVSGSKAKQAGMKNGMATAGLVLGIISIGINILGATLLAGLFAAIFALE